MYERLKNIDKRALLFILFLIAFAVRYFYQVDYLEDYDAIDFAYGLKDYNIAEYKPHFPGYPVYIFLGRLFYKVFGNETTSLVMQNVIFGSLCVPLVYLIAVELFDRGSALIAALLFFANPTVSILSVSVNSDISALFFLMLFLYYLVKSDKYADRRGKYLFISGLCLGITLGIRLSNAPFIILWLYYSRFFKLFRLKIYEEMDSDDNSFLSATAGLIIGTLAWLIPLIAVVGAMNLYYEGLKFIIGHFDNWGGSVMTDPSLVRRVQNFFWQMFPKGLGIYFVDTSLLRIIPTFVLIIAFISLVRKKFCKPKLFSLYAVPYFLWVFFGQNLEKARHILPLIPILIIFLSCALTNIFSSKKYFYAVVTAVLVLIFADTGLLLRQHKNIPPPPYSVMEYLIKETDDSDSILYCGESERFFTYYHPLYMVKRFKTIEEVQRDLDASLVEPGNVYVTSDVKGAEPSNGRGGLNVREIMVFSRSRYIYNPFNKITLYKIKRDSVNLLEF